MSFFENLQPNGYIGRVIVSDFRREFEVGAKERGAQFGNEFFAGIAFVAPALAAKIALDARRVLRPVGGFVRERCVVALRVAERLEGRHLDTVG